jgi:hypothetical protein
VHCFGSQQCFSFGVGAVRALQVYVAAKAAQCRIGFTDKPLYGARVGANNWL